MALIEAVSDIVYSAGEIMLGAVDIEASQEEKGGDYNLFTKYDVAVQKYLFEALANVLPQANFIGEEDGATAAENIGEGYHFIIDPIDGTTNFIHDFRHSSISVALIKDGAVELGFVYNPYNKELFTAQKGAGAKLDGQPIAATNHPLPETMVAFGTCPYYRDTYAAPTFDTLQKLFPHCQDVRRTGSAALDLCYVACGRIGLFFEHVLSPWDFAAASLIIEEAGGVISGMDRSPITLDTNCSILAAGRQCYKDFFEIT